MPTRASTLLVALTTCWLSSVGCGGGGYQWQKLPRYEPGTEPQTQMTNRAGTYVVGVKQRGHDRLMAIESTKTFINTGQLLGFKTDHNSHVIAYTQLSEMDLGPMPSSRVKYLRWTTRQHIEPSNFDVAVGDIAAAVGVAAVEMSTDVAVDCVLDGRDNSNEIPQSKLDKGHRGGTPQDTVP